MRTPFSFPSFLVEKAKALKIVVDGDKRLLTKLPVVEEATPDALALAAMMLKTMYANDGVGIAGNQVDFAKQIRGVGFDPLVKKLNGAPVADPHFIFNPEIIEATGEVEVQEGCLSAPDKTVKRVRAERVVVRGRDMEWNEKEVEAIGTVAIILQHEIDHLNGVRFGQKKRKGSFTAKG